MSEFLLTLLFPVRLFAFSPIACAVVAVLFTACIFLPLASRGMRTGFLFAAICWWHFAWLEKSTSTQTNIRVDLVFLGPIFQIAAYLGIGLLIRWWWKNW